MAAQTRKTSTAKISLNLGLYCTKTLADINFVFFKCEFSQLVPSSMELHFVTTDESWYYSNIGDSNITSNLGIFSIIGEAYLGKVSGLMTESETRIFNSASTDRAFIKQGVLFGIICSFTVQSTQT